MPSQRTYLVQDIPDLSIRMIRENLDNLPDYQLPEGYSFAWYKLGFEKHWLDIHLKADRLNHFGEHTFAKQFGIDDEILSKRQVYILNSDKAFIGTTSAWYADNKPKGDSGMIHWVAIIPEEQGKGLAKPLLSIIGNRLKNLSHKRAYLGTSTARIPALNLYLHFGFLPEIKNEQDEERWQLIKPYLKYKW